ncbi:MAG: DNA primase [Chloroflexi bacterium]|nr:DNA primase [Chloroflexota bacterium]
MSVVDEIKQRLDLVDVISAYTPLTKAGRNFKGLCPFHNEKTPSFIVFPETQTWHCFGACGTGGDLFAFIMRRENVDFGEALRLLAERAGVQLAARDADSARQRDEVERLREVNQAAAEHLNHVLLETPAGAPGRDYLARRGVRPETIGAFQLGYAPDEWQALHDHLRHKGYGDDDLLAAGLLSESDSGRLYDRFRGRVIFPIRDIRGRVLGFGGRVLGDGVPKYLNTPQTPLFDKGAILYGIDLAREAIREQQRAVIVEGYMDVIVPYQEGIRNVVAVMGTALSEAHINVLKRLTHTLILALDADAAGLAAVERGTETARRALPRRVVPIIQPSGLIRYEEQLDAEIRIMTLPDGLDPDELVLADRARWDALVGDALPVAEHFFRQARTELDVTTGKGKRAAMDRLLPIIQSIENAAERTHYVQQLAQWLRMDERIISEQLAGHPTATPRRRPRPRAETAVAAPPGVSQGHDALDELEQHVLGLVMEHPRLALETTNAGLLSEEAFGDMRRRRAFAVARELSASGLLPDLAEVLERLDTESRTHVESILRHRQGRPEQSPEALQEDLNKASARLLKAHLTRDIEQLQFALLDAHQEGLREREAELHLAIDRLTRQRHLVDQRYHAATYFGRRQAKEAVTRHHG